MNRRLILVLLALVLATVGTGAVLMYLRAADDRALEGKQVSTVLVADKPIPQGTSGRALRDGGYLRTVRMPAETVPNDALQQVDKDLETLVTTAAVQRGQLVLRAMFGTAAANSAGLVIPDGKLAITARVKSAVFPPAAVQAGMRVAIFYTYTPEAGNRNYVSGEGFVRERGVNNVTRLLLTDVEVISVGPRTPTDGQANGGQANGGQANGGANGSAGAAGESSVTFALSQKEAETLAHAVALGGELNIGLLGASSNVRSDTGVDNRTLFGG